MKGFGFANSTAKVIMISDTSSGRRRYAKDVAKDDDFLLRIQSYGSNEPVLALSVELSRLLGRS